MFFSSGDGPNVVVKKMSIVVDGRTDVEIDLTGKKFQFLKPKVKLSARSLVDLLTRIVFTCPCLFIWRFIL